MTASTARTFGWLRQLDEVIAVSFAAAEDAVDAAHAVETAPEPDARLRAANVVWRAASEAKAIADALASAAAVARTMESAAQGAFLRVVAARLRPLPAPKPARAARRKQRS